MSREADGLDARHGLPFGATQSLANQQHTVLARAAVPRPCTGGETFALLTMPSGREASWPQFQRWATLVCVTAWAC